MTVGTREINLEKCFQAMKKLEKEVEALKSGKFNFKGHYVEYRRFRGNLEKFKSRYLKVSSGK